MDRTLRLFSATALLEGASYVLLLFIAMPLKYWFGFPLAVKLVGWAHGVLFMAYVTLLVLCWARFQWSFVRVVLYFLASLLPILPFVVERRLKREYAAN
jgi:integral membrane protein